MSFKDNIGKPHVEPSLDQCEMINPHHPDCECAPCLMYVEPQCLEPAVGMVPESCGARVCASCAKQMAREYFSVKYFKETP